MEVEIWKIEQKHLCLSGLEVANYWPGINNEINLVKLLT